MHQKRRLATLGAPQTLMVLLVEVIRTPSSNLKSLFKSFMQESLVTLVITINFFKEQTVFNTQKTHNTFSIPQITMMRSISAFSRIMPNLIFTIGLSKPAVLFIRKEIVEEQC